MLKHCPQGFICIKSKISSDLINISDEQGIETDKNKKKKKGESKEKERAKRENVFLFLVSLNIKVGGLDRVRKT